MIHSFAQCLQRSSGIAVQNFNLFAFALTDLEPVGPNIVINCSYDDRSLDKIFL